MAIHKKDLSIKYTRWCWNYWRKFYRVILVRGLLLLGSFLLYLACTPQVTFTEGHISFLHFLTNVCAIVGGISKTFPLISQSQIYWERTFIFLMFDLMHNNDVCLLCSGVFTVSGILDSFIYHGQRAIKKKMEIGKFSWWLIWLAIGAAVFGYFVSRWLYGEES